MMTCEETLQVELAFLNPGYNDIETDWDTGLLKVDGQVLPKGQPLAALPSFTHHLREISNPE